MFEVNSRAFNSRTVDIRTTEDMKGWKVRVMGTPIWLKSFEAWGASPVAMSAGEVLGALQNKVLDGYEWMWTIVISQAGMLDVTKHFTESHSR